MKFKEKKAVVIGGSIAGLSAAVALSRHFGQVTIIERDPQQSSPSPRKCTPQSNHVHILLKSGESAIENLFPGIFSELEALGSQQVDMASRLHWFHHGVWKLRFDSNFLLRIQSRPLLEWQMQTRIRGLENVAIRNGCMVKALRSTDDNQRITGVDVQCAGANERLEADLVVDASGRGSQVPSWLQTLGYQPPSEESVQINLGYASRVYRPVGNSQPNWKSIVIYPKMGETTRGGMIFRVEENKWIVTLLGYMRDNPTSKEAEFNAFAESLPHPDVAQALQLASPVSDIQTYKIPQQTWRHYEQLKRFPAGLLILGDAHCLLDPVFGQGMSVAALEALALDRSLARAQDDLRGLSKQFHKRVAKIVAVPWMLATSEGLRYPDAVGKRPFFLKALHWYNARIFELTGTSEATYLDFMQVLHLLKLPTLLFKPQTIWRVLRR